MKIGPIHLVSPLVLAPMEDVTDISFRVMSRRLGADVVCTEFTSSEALIRDIPKAIQKIRIVDEERPAGIQIFGGNIESMAKAIGVVEKYKPDFIDINCGCASRTHVTRGEGAGLLRDLPHLAEILRAAVQATSLPVTMKTRLGWDEKNIVILDVAKIAQDAGIKALTVHCRTRAQGYKGKADWDWLGKIKKAITIPLIGNGDVVRDADVKAMFDVGCDGVMIGRGAMANPWVFCQAKHFLKTGKHLAEPTLRERVGVCLEHLELSILYKGPRWGVIMFRKYYAGYLKGCPKASKLRLELMPFEEQGPIVEKLNQYVEECGSTEIL